ncbi:hypothetical protein JW949_03050 [Candidatus Woesearchaeota archaeon]|nr:hypothetical protein [Candidatus Woesearchaeota archaeon]
MGYFAWVNKNIKKLGVWDVPFFKISLIAFGLMVAKLWEPILMLDWYWYLIIFVVTAVKPVMSMFK